MTRQEFLAVLPELVANYQPSRAVKQKISSTGLLMIIGPSGVGKTTLMNKMKMHFVPSDTTRPQRSGELDGVDYYFRQDYDALFKDMEKGNFLQVVLGVGGDLYATRGTSYPKNGMGIMAVIADVIPVFRNLGFKETLSAFITPPSFEEWQRRLQRHNLSEEQFRKRLAEGKRSLSFALADDDTHMILNDDLESATIQLNQLMDGKIDKEMEKAATDAAQNILNRLD